MNVHLFSLFIHLLILFLVFYSEINLPKNKYLHVQIVGRRVQTQGGRGALRQLLAIESHHVQFARHVDRSRLSRNHLLCRQKCS